METNANANNVAQPVVVAEDLALADQQAEVFLLPAAGKMLSPG